MITYEDKVALNENPDIADINKVTAGNMNEIKRVVNEQRTNIGDLSNLTTPSKDNLVGAINSVVESGSNDIGEYIKFASGRLVTIHQVTKNLSRTDPWGNLYQTNTPVDLGEFPIAFKYTPYIFLTLYSRDALFEAVTDASATNAGKVYLLAPVASSSANYTVQVLAIGTWE